MTKHIVYEIPSSISFTIEGKLSESVLPLALHVREDVPRASNPIYSRKKSNYGLLQDDNYLVHIFFLIDYKGLFGM